MNIKQEALDGWPIVQSRDSLEIFAELEELRRRRQSVQKSLEGRRNKIKELQRESLKLTNECAQDEQEVNEVQAQEDILLEELKQHMASARPPAYEADDQQASTSSSEAVDYDPSLQNQLDRIFGCDLNVNEWDALDALQTRTSSQLQVALADVSAPLCRKRVSNGPDSVAVKRPKAKKQLKEISLDQFRNYILNLDDLWNENAKNFNCPACERVLNLAKRKSIRHLLEHLHDPTVHPYKCPVVHDCFTSVRGDAVQSHVKAVHKLEWTESLRLASVHAANKAVIDSIVSQI